MTPLQCRASRSLPHCVFAPLLEVARPAGREEQYAREPCDSCDFARIYATNRTLHVSASLIQVCEFLLKTSDLGVIACAVDLLGVPKNKRPHCQTRVSFTFTEELLDMSIVVD